MSEANARRGSRSGSVIIHDLYHKIDVQVQFFVQSGKSIYNTFRSAIL